MKKAWQRIPAWVKNKYFLTGFAFLVWLAFFDQNDLVSQFKLKSELNKLQEDEQYYKEEIKKVETNLDELLTDNEKLETFAREKYFMKKEGEDIFVMVKKTQ